MLSDEVRRAILARDWKGKVKGERVHFCCPRHEDKTPSAWQGGGAWGCFSCGFEEPITTLAEILGIMLEGEGDYTLNDYADAKGFSVQTLTDLGLTTSTQKDAQVVRIPYFDEDGNELRARFRSRTGKWWEGRNMPIHLYGRDKLVDAKPGDRVLVVEGESDCHALWSADVLAVGVPGCTTWKPEWKSYLDGLEIFVWEEPDQGGAQLVERMTASYPTAKIVRSDDVKDVCELRQRNGDDFATTVNALMDVARPYNAMEPPVAFDRLNTTRFAALLAHQLTPIDAVPTPFPAWNRASRDEGGGVGLARGWHVLAAARTGVGKSILALNVAAAAMRAGESVCFLSLEMSQVQVETRIMAILSGLPVSRFEKGSAFDERAFRDAAAAFDRVNGSFITNRAPIRSVQDIERSIQSVHEIHGSRFFIVDYLQLAGNQNDPESITNISGSVRQQARDLEVVTFGLSQFNRSTSSLNETPTVNGLMGGSSLENDADQVVLVDHSKLQPDAHGWTTNLLIAKNRHGTRGAIPFQFSSKTLQMRELLQDEVPERLG